MRCLLQFPTYHCQVESSFQHVRNICDIAATNHTEIVLKSPLVYTCDVMMQLERSKNFIEKCDKSRMCKRAFSKQSFRYINRICVQLSSLMELKFEYKIYFKIASFYSTFTPAITDRKPLQFKEKRTERLAFSFRAPLDPGLYFRHVEHTVIMIHQ